MKLQFTNQIKTTFQISILCLLIHPLLGQNTGTIISNTNDALPSSYNFQEYVYPEPNDQGSCTGVTNTSAVLENVFFAQTHRLAIDHPLFFLVGHRPALLQVAVTGDGATPDVEVTGTLNGNSLGTLCLTKPESLPATIDLTVPDFNNYYYVTLPKSWMQNGLELSVNTGQETRILTPEQLKIGPLTELNLVLVYMDILDYNDEPYEDTRFDDFLEEMASAIPASVVRFGIFPDTLKMNEMILANGTEQLLRLTSADQLEANNIPEGSVNLMANNFLSETHIGTGDYLSTIYFGNTMNLQPGGWGGNRSMVGFDYTDIFIHELGHALSLPHWEEAFNESEITEDSYVYPYGGDTNDGGGRGESWNFIQEGYEFVDPICRDTNDSDLGIERSDCMQREFSCLGERSDGFAPWDGFGDFSAAAMHRFFIGGDPITGTVTYRDNDEDYQLGYQDGYPNVTAVNGERIYTRDPLQQQADYPESTLKLFSNEQINQDVYLVYGVSHPTQSQANIVYEPIAFNGTLPGIIDPTDEVTFEMLQNLDPAQVPSFDRQAKDITLKLFYEDGTISHVLAPYQSPLREEEEYDGPLDANRFDLAYFNVVVPATASLCNVEVYERLFFIGDENDNTPGNINFAPFNITSANFMEGAVLKSHFTCGSLSIDEQVIADTVKVSPNPFYNEFFITDASAQQKTIEIYNVHGQLVKSQKLNGATSIIDTADLSNGFYLGVLLDQNKAIITTKKLLKK